MKLLRSWWLLLWGHVSLTICGHGAAHVDIGAPALQPGQRGLAILRGPGGPGGGPAGRLETPRVTSSECCRSSPRPSTTTRWCSIGCRASCPCGVGFQPDSADLAHTGRWGLGFLDRSYPFCRRNPTCQNTRRMQPRTQVQETKDDEHTGPGMTTESSLWRERTRRLDGIKII